MRKPARVPVAPPPANESETVRYGFLLLPEFPIYALIPAIEALRIANQNRGRKLYSWHLFFEVAAIVGLAIGALGVTGLVVGCTLMVRETRLAVQTLAEEAGLSALGNTSER